jgi:hypothetical protein
MADLSTKDEQLLDFATDIAKAANLLIQIDESTSVLPPDYKTTLRVINRIQAKTYSQTVRTPELLSLIVTPAFPIKTIYSEYEYNTPYPISVVLATETKRVEVHNLTYGEEQEYEALSQDEKKVEEHLRNILISESAFQANARVFGVQDTWNIGDRILCVDERQMVQANIIIFSIVYDFDGEETTITGAADVEFVRYIS